MLPLPEDKSPGASYRYRISLRVRHPSIDPARITEALQREPFREWRAGDPRTAPKGRPLGGDWHDSYWAAKIVDGDSIDKKLNATINDTLDLLVPHRSFFRQLRLEGGSIELFIGWFFERQSGEVFDCELLARLADMQIDLDLDVYS